jgi:hypothetical protein
MVVQAVVMITCTLTQVRCYAWFRVVVFKLGDRSQVYGKWLVVVGQVLVITTCTLT